MLKFTALSEGASGSAALGWERWGQRPDPEAMGEARGRSTGSCHPARGWDLAGTTSTDSSSPGAKRSNTPGESKRCPFTAVRLDFELFWHNWFLERWSQKHRGGHL